MREVKFCRARDRLFSRGITLIETLVSVVVLVILLATVFSIHHTVSATLSFQRNCLKTWVPAASAMDNVLRDLRCCTPIGATGDQFMLTLDERTGCSSLAFESIPAPPATNDLANAPAYQIRYSVQFSNDSDYAGSLIREVGSLNRNHSGTALETLAENISLFRVSVFDGKNWTDAWMSGKTKSLPTAARITLSCTDTVTTNTITTATIIPAGAVTRRAAGVPRK